MRAHLADAHFIFFAYDDGAASSAAFVFGVSWASLSRTNRTFSPLFSTLTVILNVSRSLSFTHKISCAVQIYCHILRKLWDNSALILFAHLPSGDSFKKREKIEYSVMFFQVSMVA